MAWIAGH